MDWNDFPVTALTITASTYQKMCTLLYNEMIEWLLFYTKNNEELCNDIFLKIIRNIGYFNPKRGKFSNFCFTIAKNEYHEYYKKQHRKRKIDIKYTNTLYDTIIDDSSEYEDNELWMTRLTNKLNTLDTKDQRFINDYIHSTTNKKPSERTRFYLLLKQLKQN
jgi:RNA polymerase sigma factor (sigma-70 family)